MAFVHLLRIGFGWIYYIPKLLFDLPEVKLSKRFLKTIAILLTSLVYGITINMVWVFAKLPSPLIVIIKFISIFLFFAFVTIQAARFIKKNSIDVKFSYGCLVAGFLIMNEKTLRRELVPRIYRKLPGRIIVDTPGWTTVEIEGIIGQLESAMKISIGGVEPWIVDGQVQKGYNVLWYSLKDLPGMVPFESTVARDLPAPGYIKLGLSMKGWITLHLKDITHFLVFSQTGYGKSVELENIITQLYLTIPTSTFFLIDFKGGETFEKYRGINNIVTVTNCDTEDSNESYRQAIGCLRMVYKIMKIRQSLIGKEGRKSYYEFGLFPIIVVIEEMREFFRGWQQDVKIGKKKMPSYAAQAAALVDMLTAEGRSSGIHVFLATQRFDVGAGPAYIRDNLPLKLGGSVGSPAASKMLFTTEFLYRMPKIKGRMAFMNMDEGGGFVTIQVPYLKPGQSLKYIRDKEHTQVQESYTNLIWASKNPRWWYKKGVDIPTVYTDSENNGNGNGNEAV